MQSLGFIQGCRRQGQRRAERERLSDDPSPPTVSGHFQKFARLIPRGEYDSFRVAITRRVMMFGRAMGVPMNHLLRIACLEGCDHR